MMSNYCSNCQNCFIKDGSGCVQCLSVQIRYEQQPYKLNIRSERGEDDSDVDRVVCSTINSSSLNETQLDSSSGRHILINNESRCGNLGKSVVDGVICPTEKSNSSKEMQSLEHSKNRNRLIKEIRILEDVIIKPFVDVPSRSDVVQDKIIKQFVGVTTNKSEVAQTSLKKKAAKFKYPSHLSWEIINGNIEFECKICNKTFRSRSSRNYHLYCDKSVEKPFSCVQCAKKFATKHHMQYHENSHNNIQHACNECDRTFLSLISLKKHLKIHSGDFKFICDNCDLKFYTKSALILHMYKHKEAPLPFHCDTCNKSFSAKFKLNQHLAIHKKLKLFTCNLCGKKLSRNSTLTMHMQTHSNSETKYECKVCLKSFDKQRSYDRHMKIKHGSTFFRCPLCNVQSGRKDNVLRHIRNLHSDENFDDISKKISIDPLRQKVKRPKTSSSKSNLNVDLPIKCDVTCKPVTDTCQYQSVIKFAGRSQTSYESPSSASKLEEQQQESIFTSVNDCSSPTENVLKKLNNELRIELIEPTESTECDPKISNISIYRQLLSPYLKPPPNLDLRNGTSDQHTHKGFIRNQNNHLSLRKDNVDIYRSILMTTDVEFSTEIPDNSNVLHENTKLSKTESRVIRQSREYFSEMHWRKRTSQCFSKMETE